MWRAEACCGMLLALICWRFGAVRGGVAWRCVVRRCSLRVAGRHQLQSYIKRTSFACHRTPSVKSFNLVYAFCHELLSLRRSELFRGLGWSFFLRFPLSFSSIKDSLQFRLNVCISGAFPRKLLSLRRSIHRRLRERLSVRE